MPEYLSISKRKPKFPDYLDFQSLRQIGIKHLQSLSSKLWTDYNLHDPGVTILEVLCYAITDLGYRNNLDIKDLLALKDLSNQDDNFFTPDQVLSCNPVTILDVRRRLIDIPGVRNAWLEKLQPLELEPDVQPYEPAIFVDCQQNRLQYSPPAGKLKQDALRLEPRGLYNVCLDLEPELRQDACGRNYRSWSDILERVKKVLCSYRNLCEDFYDLIVLGEEEIGLCSDIELETSADPEDVLVEIYVRVQEFLAPRLPFYTLQELLERGKNPAEIFAGRPSALSKHDRHSPYASYNSHGFVDTAELEALKLPKVLYTSDLYQIIMDVPGVTAIKKLSIINYINGLRQSQGDPWCLYLTPKHRPVLGVEHSTVTLFKGDLPFKADAEEVKRRYYQQQTAYIKVPRNDHELDLNVPRGSYYDLADYYSIHHDFPLTYGIGHDGLPKTAPALRQAQARQLKGYLVFFDQLLANYLAQLAHVRDLFSWSSEAQRQDRQRTYFTQVLNNIPAVEEIIRNYKRCDGSNLPDTVPVDYPAFLDYISEDPFTYQDRRNRFLDHLLARFAENFTDYVVLNYQIEGGHRNETDIIDEKARFLQEYPSLSRDRFRAFDYCDCQRVWDTDNVSGLQKRVSRLLGIKKMKRRSLSHYKIVQEAGGYIFILGDVHEDLSLKSKLVYSTLTAAQLALEEFLPFALEPAHYKRLSYRYFYHYGWEVLDPQGAVIAVYDRYFPTQAERNTALSPLLQDLKAVLAVPATDEAEVKEVETYFHLDSQTGGYFSFRLEIPVPEKSPLTFTGIQRYPSEAEARNAAEEALEQIQNVAVYRQSRPRGNEPEFTELFTYYGYAVMNPAGQLLAGNPTLYSTEQERDEALSLWLTSLQSNQNQWLVEAATECFFWEIKHKTGQQNLLRGIRGLPTQVEAEEQLTTGLVQGQLRSAYLLTEKEGVFGFSLHLELTIPFAHHPYTYATARERDLRLDALLYYLNRPEPKADIEGETGTYQATLLDSDGSPLLITHHSYSTQSQAEAAYQRLLYLASDSVYYQIIDDLEGPHPYGFFLVDRRGNTFATHSRAYPTSCQRDLVIRSIINYVNKEIQCRLVNREGNIYSELIDRDESPLLVGANGYADETEAIAAFEEMLVLAQEQSNYQLIDDAPGDCPYSFALYDGTNLVASHPEHYATVEERDQALQALVNCVISDDPNYRIDGVAGQFTYALVDILAQTGEPPYLLISAVTYPDTDAAQNAFGLMVARGASQANYYRLNDLPAPTNYGFDLRDETGEIIATHQDGDGNPIAYATEAEREAAITKIAYYLAQAQIRSEIVNEEGAFSAQVQDEQGETIWSGRQIFPDSEAAEDEAKRICALAQYLDKYLLVNTGIGTCPYSFALKDEADVVVADHPSFYPTQVARDRQIQRWQLAFTGAKAFLQIREHDVSYTFQVWDASEQIIVRGTEYESESAAQEILSRVLLRSKDPEAYQPVQRRADGWFSFTLEDSEGTILAEHPSFYATESERDTVQQAVYHYLRTGGVPYQLDEDEGNVSWRLLDANNQTWLLSEQSYSSEATAFATLLDVLELASIAESYSINPDPTHCNYELVLMSEGTVVARHPQRYLTEAEAQEKIDNWLAYLDSIKLGQVQSVQSVFSWEMPAAPLCLFYDCEPLKQQVFSTGAILSSPPGKTFTRAAEAREDFLKQLPLVLEDDNFKRDYDNQACTFSFSLQDSATKNIVAISPRLYRQRSEMEAAIAFIKKVARGFTFAKIAPGTHCGYYFSLLLPGEGETAVRLKSLNRYPSEKWAWQAAGLFAENLRYLRRYVNHVEGEAGQVYGFGIVDGKGTLLAATELELEPTETFIQLNQVEPFLDTELLAEAGTDPLSGHRFKLIDRHQLTLLEGTQLLADASDARDHFYRDVLGFLFESGTIEATANPTAQTFSFRVVSFSPDSESEVEVLAVHPQCYSSPSQRDQAIKHLLILLRTTQITPEIEQQLPAYVGQIVGAADEILLQSSRRHTYELAYLGSALPNGDLIPIWYEKDQDWQDVSAELVSLAANNQLKTQVISAGEDAVDRPLYRFQLAATETTWLVGSERYLNQNEAEARGNYALSLLKQLYPPDTSSEIAEFLHRRQRYQRRLEWTMVLLDLASEEKVNSQETKEEKAQQAACQQGNVLLELAQDKDNFRLIDDDDGICTYGWELTNEGKDKTLAVSEHYYTSKSQREEAIAALQKRSNDEGFHLVEHILLRPRQQDPELPREALLPISVSEEDCNREGGPCRTSYDPYSFWVSVILPYWPQRFRNQNFRRFVEQTLRLEAPAHVALKICWVDVCQMRDFEVAYRDWLKQLALDSCQDAACYLTGALNRLLAILPQLKNVYPEATLHDCQESGSEDNPIILNQTALGTAND